MTLAFITRQDFLASIQQFPEDYQKFCQIRDNMNLYSNYRGCGIKCLSCHRLEHQFSACPYL